MAPDKIWVTTSEMTALLSERRHDYDVAYLRKDALLEWANNGIKRVKENSSLNSIIARAAIAAFEELIEKLNSM